MSATIIPFPVHRVGGVPHPSRFKPAPVNSEPGPDIERLLDENPQLREHFGLDQRVEP